MSKYSVTTFEPGARLDFTHGRRSRPRSTAFFARRPAATITNGFDVFVHEVIAAITTEPWSSRTTWPSSSHSIPAVRSGATATGAASTSWPPVDSWEPGSVYEGGSLAGNDSASASSTGPP